MDFWDKERKIGVGNSQKEAAENLLQKLEA